MPEIQDGPHSPLFATLSFAGNTRLSDLTDADISEGMAAALDHAPSGSCVSWGIPFEIDSVLLLNEGPVTIECAPTTAQWFIFMHTSDLPPIETNAHGFISPMRGQGRLAEHTADYILLYADGTEERAAIRRRHQIGAFSKRWGENCFQAVAHQKPHPMRAAHEQTRGGWGRTQTRTIQPGNSLSWINWLWAWQNPQPRKEITGIRFEPVSGPVLVMAVSAGNASSNPLRWQTRRKACLALPEGVTFQPDSNDFGLLEQIQLDLGQVISAVPRPVYPQDEWPDTDNNRRPFISNHEILIEYTAHPDANFHLSGGHTTAVAQVEAGAADGILQPVERASRRVNLRVVEKENGRVVPVRLHVHGEWGEYLAPIDRHRIPNSAWFEDYSVDYVHTARAEPDRAHYSTYIPGETVIDLPLGQVYVEVSKGFEIRPLRTIIEVTADTETITLKIERALHWREKGWVTADTHVHFLSPTTSLLEGSAEGVNVINLLASQWGELMTNVGDFDGRTTWGSKEAGGDGEYLVRVGTENRQHVLGHISLLGYQGSIIVPLCSGGPDESALGDPVAVLLTEWARQCKKQGGLVVMPHFPDPRLENAASIIEGDIDAIEMTSWGELYVGIDPYSLSDWYRYLNCGYLVPLAGGTDKMTANTAVGTIRTYARIAANTPFTYQSWMEAVRRAETFVTYGPLLEFAVDGQPMGSRIGMSASGGTVDVTWQVASVTTPMTRVELVVNGEIRESAAVSPNQAAGHWSFKVEKSGWLALLVRGHQPEQPEIIAAHSSPVMITLEGSPLLAAADAVTILEQIEGALAYVDAIGTRADEKAYKRMRLVLTSAHRTLHNRMHAQGYYHEHTPVTAHHE
ncbi:MAG: CehA/McbA family metallohydrolase [Chloroflexota bacterium]|nr:CehA/McbA family metallohydrolase [Chloroflexota bacterium]